MSFLGCSLWTIISCENYSFSLAALCAFYGISTEPHTYSKIWFGLKKKTKHFWQWSFGIIKKKFILRINNQKMGRGRGEGQERGVTGILSPVNYSTEGSIFRSRVRVFIGDGCDQREGGPLEEGASSGRCKQWLMTRFWVPICPLIFMHGFCLIINSKTIVYQRGEGDGELKLPVCLCLRRGSMAAWQG